MWPNQSNTVNILGVLFVFWQNVALMKIVFVDVHFQTNVLKFFDQGGTKTDLSLPSRLLV
jgi:hypothetical protein